MALRTAQSLDRGSLGSRLTIRTPFAVAGDRVGFRQAAGVERANGVLLAFALGAAFVGALWLLSESVRGHARPAYDDPYENVPYDDEPLSEEELRQLAESRNDIARGDVYSWEEVVDRRSATA